MEKARKNCIGCSNFVHDEPWCLIPEIKEIYFIAITTGECSEPSYSWKTDGSFCGFYNCDES